MALWKWPCPDGLSSQTSERSTHSISVQAQTTDTASGMTECYMVRRFRSFEHAEPSKQRNRAIVKSGVQAVESSDFLIDLLHFNAVVEFDSGDDLSQVVKASDLRQRFSAHSPTLSIMCSIVSRDRQPLDRFVRCRMVANVDSMGLVVRMLCQCLAGKS